MRRGLHMPNVTVSVTQGSCHRFGGKTVPAVTVPSLSRSMRSSRVKSISKKCLRVP